MELGFTFRFDVCDLRFNRTYYTQRSINVDCHVSTYIPMQNLMAPVFKSVTFIYLMVADNYIKHKTVLYRVVKHKYELRRRGRGGAERQ